MIKVHKLWKSYNEMNVLKGLSLNIAPSKVTIILGRSGVGKSVLLKQISGIEWPDKGKIEIDGINLCALSGKARMQTTSQIGMLFQNSALFDSMTIEENIAFALMHRKKELGINRGEIQQEVDKALEKVELSGFQKKFPCELSGGQKRRAALARLIVYKPRILLFDEPTTGLDPITSGHIIRLIAETQKSLQSTAVVVTHDILLALTIGDYFALHHEGAIAMSGDRERFFSSSNPLLQEFLSNALIPDQLASLIKRTSAEVLA